MEVTGLRKEYRKLRGATTIAVDGLDLVVESGGVFGFLGPNGSGKTTTIRCLLGLIRPTTGTAHVFGHDSTRDLASVIRRIGAIVEAPAQFPTMTARRNLELLA
ncbi:MAG: ATP-binding cassette domain-containing protein, partial [Actinobacteria bacterium]|nr:ATP-binding cassette domain-containing protein [Actinomycetota bacterium]